MEELGLAIDITEMAKTHVPYNQDPPKIREDSLNPMRPVFLLQMHFSTCQSLPVNEVCYLYWGLIWDGQLSELPLLGAFHG